jgi:hypothetical protein
MNNTKVRSINLLKQRKSQVDKHTTQKVETFYVQQNSHFAQKLSLTTQKSSPFNRFDQTTQKLSHLRLV